MPKTKERPIVLAKKERVRAAQDLRGVPKGTEGTVMMVTGLSWIRYWVRFDNGFEMGQLHRDKLVRVNEWDRWLDEQAELAARAAQEPTEAATASAADDASSDDSGGSDAGAESLVPAHLLERSRLARERLGA